MSLSSYELNKLKSGRKESGRYRYWRDEEVTRLAELAKSMSAAEVAQVLGRSVKSVKQAALVRGFSFRKNLRSPYTANDDLFIRANLGKLSVPDIARHLGRTKKSVHNRIGRLGLYCTFIPVVKFIYPEDDVELCRQLGDAGLAASEIADKMEIPVDSVRRWLSYQKRINALPKYIYDIRDRN